MYFFSKKTLERLHNLCYNGIIRKKERTKKMNKIYNNLSIENLIKTEWFNQFNEDQRYWITEGLENKIDVSVYANPEMSDSIMEEIFYSQISNIDIMPYVNEGYSLFQLMEIRAGLEANLDISYYNNINFDWQQMERIRVGLEDNLDVSQYAKPELSFEEMEKTRFRLENEIE